MLLSTPHKTPKAPAPHQPQIHPVLRQSRRLMCRLTPLDGGAAVSGWVQEVSPRNLTVIVAEPLPTGTTFEVLLVNAQATYLVRKTLTVRYCERVIPSGCLALTEFQQDLLPGEMMPFLV